MNKIKRFLLSILLSEEQRIVLWNALWYRNQLSVKENDFDEAVATQIVMKEVEYILGVTKVKYTQEEVDDVVKRAVEEAYASGRDFGLNNGMMEAQSAKSERKSSDKMYVSPIFSTTISDEYLKSILSNPTSNNGVCDCIFCKFEANLKEEKLAKVNKEKQETEKEPLDDDVRLNNLSEETDDSHQL